MEKENIYCSFLLRIWVEPNEDNMWRFSLEDTRTGRRKGFASLKKMIQYLEQITEQRECNKEVKK